MSTGSLEARRRNFYRNLSSWTNTTDDLVRRSPWQACWLHATLESEEETEAAQSTEEVRKLAKILKAGTDFRTLKEVQRFIRVAREGVEGTLENMDGLNNEVKEFTEYDLGAD